MRRPPLRLRRRVLWIGVGFTPVALFAGPVAAAALAASAVPEPTTVTFTSQGLDPLVCVSRPDRAAAEINTDARFELINDTGGTATLTVDWAGIEPVELADGQAVEITLKQGEYKVRMSPDCLVPLAQPLTLKVVPGAEVNGPPPNSEPGPTATTEQPALTPGPDLAAPAAGSAASDAEAGVRVTGTAASVPATVAVPVGETGAPALTGSKPGLDGGVSVSKPFQGIAGAARDDSKGENLVAVIAAICVFGVTSGIIRAIVSQRSSSVSST